MALTTTTVPHQHSGAWVAQSWISFVLSLGTTIIGIWYMPVELWTKAFMWMGLFFTVGSAVTLAKTLRDQHESTRIHARIDEARFHKLITEHDPLAPPA